MGNWNDRLFLLINAMNRLMRNEAAKPPAPSKQEQLLAEIRDLLRGQRSGA